LWWTGQRLEADWHSFGGEFLDRLLLARGGQIDLRAWLGPIRRWDEGQHISFYVSGDLDLWILDQEIVELVAELDELLFGFGLLGVLDHGSSIGPGPGQGNGQLAAACSGVSL